MGLIIGAAGVYAFTYTSAKTTTVTSAASAVTLPGSTVTVTAPGTGSQQLGTVTIGVLTDLTSTLSSTGARVAAYAQQAATDINTWVATTQWAGKVTFKVDVVDYALDSTKADQDLKAFAASGIYGVVGPLNSGSAEAILGDANSLHVVLVSPSSTSPALAIPNDYLFRTAPDDVYQGQADATTMYSQGVRGLIIVYRDDTYGDGLYNYTKADFNTIGGSGVAVDAVPYSSSATSFTNILPTINSDYQNLVTKYGANAVAIDAISFEELGYLLSEAKTSYPSLLTTPQPWYGTDGVNGDTALTNSTYGSLMQSIRMAASVFGYQNSSKTAAVCHDFTSPALSCESYGLGAYDDTWLLALSVLDCGAYSGPCIQSVISSVADNYFGVTGWTQLNAAGDRNGGNFFFSCVEPSPEAAGWYPCGVWSATTDTVTWYSGMQPST